MNILPTFKALCLGVLCLISSQLFSMENKQLTPIWDTEDELLFEKLSYEMAPKYNEDCPICLEGADHIPLWVKIKDKFSGHKNNSHKITLSCNHSYHDYCLKPMLTIPAIHEKQNFCSLCRGKFIINDVYSEKFLDECYEYLHEAMQWMYDVGAVRYIKFDIAKLINAMAINLKNSVSITDQTLKQEKLKKLWNQIYYLGKFVKLNKPDFMRYYIFDKVAIFFLTRIFLLHTFNPEASHQGVAEAQWILRLLGTSYNSTNFQNHILYTTPFLLTALRIYTAKGK